MWVVVQAVAQLVAHWGLLRESSAQLLVGNEHTLVSPSFVPLLLKWPGSLCFGLALVSGLAPLAFPSEVTLFAFAWFSTRWQVASNGFLILSYLLVLT